MWLAGANGWILLSVIVSGVSTAKGDDCLFAQPGLRGGQVSQLCSQVCLQFRLQFNYLTVCSGFKFQVYLVTHAYITIHVIKVVY